MKKLMFALVAAGAAAVMGDAIESQNIVGYQDVSKGAVKQPMFGFTFTPVSGAATVKLGAVTAKGMIGGSDIIQVINPTTLGMTTAYTYYSDAQARAEAAEEAEGETGATSGEDYDEVYAEVYDELKELVGWWVGAALGGTSADDVDIAVGSGFLGLSDTANNISFTCNGEAPTTSKAYCAGAVKQPIIANFLPARMYLKDILVGGMVGGSDIIQVINPTTLGMTTAYTYYSDAQARAEAAEEAESETGATSGEDYDEVYAEVYDELKELVGWWVGAALGGTSADNVIVEPGDAFLVLSDTANALTFNFKSVLDLTPIAAE